MARIIYGVCGEGMGHAMRSEPVIEHLTKRNHVKIFSSGRAYGHLSEKFDDVKETGGLFIRYRNNKVAKFRTLLFNISNICRIIRSIRDMMRHIDTFRPDVMISDFELSTAYAAFIKRIPLISIDNQHVYDKTKISIPRSLFCNHIETSIVNRIVIIYARYYVITTFFYGKPRSGKVFLTRPLVRDSVLKMNPEDKGYLLVYQTSDTNEKLIEAMKKAGVKAVVYGFNKDEIQGKLTFRRFDGKKGGGFLKDLAGCSAVITNGGFTLMSEALHLGKPILSIPVVKQFEQEINAIYLEKSGYGRHIRVADEEEIKDFISNIGRYKKNLRGYDKEDNSMTFRMLDNLIKDLSG